MANGDFYGASQEDWSRFADLVNTVGPDEFRRRFAPPTREDAQGSRDRYNNPDAYDASDAAGWHNPNFRAAKQFKFDRMTEEQKRARAEGMARRAYLTGEDPSIEARNFAPYMEYMPDAEELFGEEWAGYKPWWMRAPGDAPDPNRYPTNPDDEYRQWQEAQPGWRGDGGAIEPSRGQELPTGYYAAPADPASNPQQRMPFPMRGGGDGGYMRSFGGPTGPPSQNSGEGRAYAGGSQYFDEGYRGSHLPMGGGGFGGGMPPQMMQALQMQMRGGGMPQGGFGGGPAMPPPGMWGNAPMGGWGMPQPRQAAGVSGPNPGMSPQVRAAMAAVKPGNQTALTGGGPNRWGRDGSDSPYRQGSAAAFQDATKGQGDLTNFLAAMQSKYGQEASRWMAQGMEQSNIAGPGGAFGGFQTSLNGRNQEYLSPEQKADLDAYVSQSNARTEQGGGSFWGGRTR